VFDRFMSYTRRTLLVSAAPFFVRKLISGNSVRPEFPGAKGWNPNRLGAQLSRAQGTGSKSAARKNG